MITTWSPANEVEARLLAAVAADERAEFFEIISAAPLYLPILGGGDVSPGGASGRQLVTWDMGGVTYLVVFTSPVALAAVIDDPDVLWMMTSYPTLREQWPVSGWRLAVNPGLPIDAWATIEGISEAATGIVRVASTRDFLDRSNASPEAALLAAAGPTMDECLTALLACEVLVPTSQPVAASWDPTAIVGSDFPWRIVPGEGESAIAVFSTPETFAVGCPVGTPCVWMDVVSVVASWPDEALGLVVDEGSVSELRFSAAEVPALVLWADGRGDLEEPADSGVG